MIVLENIDDDIYYNDNFKKKEDVGFFQKQYDEMQKVSKITRNFSYDVCNITNWLLNYSIYQKGSIKDSNELEYTDPELLEKFIDILVEYGISYSVDSENSTISFKCNVFDAFKDLKPKIFADYTEGTLELKNHLTDTIRKTARNKRNIATLLANKQKYQTLIDKEIGKDVMYLDIIDGDTLKITLNKDYLDEYNEIKTKFNYKYINAENVETILGELFKCIINA